MKQVFSVLLVIALAGLILFGYISNIVEVMHHFSDPLTVGMVLRLIGILVAPLGIIMGYV